MHALKATAMQYNWMQFAETHHLPQEDIKIASGGEQGWPSGMLSPVIATKLHGMGITNVSTICHDALSMGREQFELKYGHGDAWTKVHHVEGYFCLTVGRVPQNLAELKSRLAAAAAKSAPNVPRCPDNHLLVPCDGALCNPYASTISRQCNECKQQLAMDSPGILRCGVCQYDCCQPCQNKKGWK